MQSFAFQSNSVYQAVEKHNFSYFWYGPEFASNNRDFIWCLKCRTFWISIFKLLYLFSLMSNLTKISASTGMFTLMWNGFFTSRSLTIISSLLTFIVLSAWTEKFHCADVTEFGLYPHHFSRGRLYLPLISQWIFCHIQPWFGMYSVGIKSVRPCTKSQISWK